MRILATANRSAENELIDEDLFASPGSFIGTAPFKSAQTEPPTAAASPDEADATMEWDLPTSGASGHEELFRHWGINE